VLAVLPLANLCRRDPQPKGKLLLGAALSGLKWTPNLRQVFKWDTVQRNG